MNAKSTLEQKCISKKIPGKIRFNNLFPNTEVKFHIRAIFDDIGEVIVDIFRISLILFVLFILI